MTQRLGLTIGLEGESLKGAVDLCVRAEELGYTDVWSAEVGGTDGFSPLAACARETSTVRLGTAIVPIFTRPPALLAMSAASVADLSGGRFVLGLGTSSSIIVENWMGGSFEKPLARLAEYVTTIRSALAGEKVSFEGDTVALDSYRLQHSPRAEVPIYVAALGRKACELAGAIADGVIFFMKSPAGIEQAMEWVEAGASQAGRDVDELDRVIRIPALVDEAPEAAALLARKLITGYAIVDVYNRSLAQQGFGPQVEAIAGAFWSGDRKAAVAAVTQEMVDELLVVGNADDCRAQFDRFRKSGINTPVVLPLSAAEEVSEKTARAKVAVEALAPAARSG